MTKCFGPFIYFFSTIICEKTNRSLDLLLTRIARIYCDIFDSAIIGNHKFQIPRVDQRIYKIFRPYSLLVGLYTETEIDAFVSSKKRRLQKNLTDTDTEEAYEYPSAGLHIFDATSLGVRLHQIKSKWPIRVADRDFYFNDLQ